MDSQFLPRDAENWKDSFSKAILNLCNNKDNDDNNNKQEIHNFEPIRVQRSQSSKSKERWSVADKTKTLAYLGNLLLDTY